MRFSAGLLRLVVFTWIRMSRTYLWHYSARLQQQMVRCVPKPRFWAFLSREYSDQPWHLSNHLYCPHEMSRVVRKPAFCICENKGADQLRGNREADQRLCFRIIDSTITLLPKYDISSLYPSYAVVQPGPFVWDLVGNPEDRFSHNEAQIS